MTALTEWAVPMLTASTALMLLVLVARTPVRRWAGAGVAYALWALPLARMVLPSLPTGEIVRFSGDATTVLFVGPSDAIARVVAPVGPSLGIALAVVWLAGAAALFATFAIRHAMFCRRLRATGTTRGAYGGIAVIAADVDGPLAFGVFRRTIAVPLGFDRDYVPAKRDLALAHEAAHHRHGDLIANWVSLAVLAAHWWNPIAWVALRAFRADQEFAADASVLDAAPGAVATYADVLAKAAGIGAIPVCHLNLRSTLKGRLMMLGYHVSTRRRVVAAAALTLIGSAALAATAMPTHGKQATTIGVKPDGAGGYALIVGGTIVRAGAPLPGGMTLPADFDTAGGCDLKTTAKPHAMVLKGAGATMTYTVTCASAAAAPVRTTLTEGLASLKTMRASIASQPASAAFPEAERTHALGAVDRSIAAVAALLAKPK